MTTSIWICIIVAVFGLGLFFGNLLCEIEEWTWGMTIALTRIIGISLFAAALIVAAIIRVW